MLLMRMWRRWRCRLVRSEDLLSVVRRRFSAKTLSSWGVMQLKCCICAARSWLPSMIDVVGRCLRSLIGFTTMTLSDGRWVGSLRLVSTKFWRRWIGVVWRCCLIRAASLIGLWIDLVARGSGELASFAAYAAPTNSGRNFGCWPYWRVRVAGDVGRHLLQRPACLLSLSFPAARLFANSGKVASRLSLSGRI